MVDEIQELLDAAIRKEIEAQSNYMVAKEKIGDPVAQGLLRALADEEGQHARRIGELKGFDSDQWIEQKISELKDSDLIKSDVIEPDAGIDEILRFAIHREQLSIEFYSKMTGALKGKKAKAICEELGRDELHHKVKIELMYNDLYLK